MNNIALKVENVSKQYRLGTVGTGTLSQDLNRWFAKIRGKEDPFLKIGETNDRTSTGSSEFVWALKDLNFEIKKGDVVGIIGRNGAGKSTLLKLLSKTTLPTTGSIKINGRIASLLEVGTGFHPELTGRDNIFLNGAILGMTKKEIQSKFDEIVEFAGVARYVDTPVKRYSSGMYVRLAFAVAAHLDPDILIVDEVLAVGDAEFQKKAIGKMKSVSEEGGRTVLFVSHNMGAVKQLCNSGIYMKNGTVTGIGLIDDIVNLYLNSNETSEVQAEYIVQGKDKQNLHFQKIFIQNSEKIRKQNFLTTEEIEIVFTVIQQEYINNSSLFVTIMNIDLVKVFSSEILLDFNVSNYTLIIDKNFLSGGSYHITSFIHVANYKRYDEVESVCKFNIIDESSIFIKYGNYNHGLVLGNYKWKKS